MVSLFTIILCLGISYVVFGYLMVFNHPNWTTIHRNHDTFHKMSEEAVAFLRAQLPKDQESLNKSELMKFDHYQKWFERYFGAGYDDTCVAFCSGSASFEQIFHGNISKQFLKWKEKHEK